MIKNADMFGKYSNYVRGSENILVAYSGVYFSQRNTCISGFFIAELREKIYVYICKSGKHIIHMLINYIS